MTTLRTLMVTIVWMASASWALAADVHDFLSWQRQYGFAQDESLELIFERTATPLQVRITNAEGQVIGAIDLATDPAAGSAGRPGHSPGFGFVTFGAANGVLLIDGRRYGLLSSNPWTGRYVLGFTLVSSMPGASGQPPRSATLTVVGSSGQTRASFKLENAQVVSYKVGGG